MDNSSTQKGNILIALSLTAFWLQIRERNVSHSNFDNEFMWISDFLRTNPNFADLFDKDRYFAEAEGLSKLLVTEQNPDEAYFRIFSDLKSSWQPEDHKLFSNILFSLVTIDGKVSIGVQGCLNMIAPHILNFKSNFCAQSCQSEEQSFTASHCESSTSLNTDKVDAEDKPIISFGKIFIVIIYLFVIAKLGTSGSEMLPWSVALSSLMIIVPIFVTGLYFTSIRKILNYMELSETGFFFSFFKKAGFFTYLMWITYSLLAGAYLFAQMSVQNFQKTFVELLLFVFVFILCCPFIDKYVGTNYKKFSRTRKILIITSFLSIFITSAIYSFIDQYSLNTDYYLDSFKDSIEYVKNSYVQPKTNSLGLFQDFISWKDGIILFLIQTDSPVLNIIKNFLSSLGFFANISPLISCFFIPSIEKKRIVTAPIAEYSSPIVSKIFWLFFWLIIGSLIYVEVIILMESNIRDTVRPHFNNFTVETTKIADRIRVEYEIQGGIAVTPGTTEKYNKYVSEKHRDILTILWKKKYEITAKKYDLMEDNINIYLDWYYSLAADYTRLVKLATGELESFTQEKLAECLHQQNVINCINSYNEFLRNIYDMKLLSFEEFAKDRRIDIDSLDPKKYEIVKIDAPSLLSFSDIFQDTPFIDEYFEERIGASSIAGALTAKVLAKKIASTAATKGIIKTGASVLAKIIAKAGASSLGGVTGGAALGASIGSVVPGVGTAAGAVVGGIVSGIAAWVTTDKILLEAEELFSRSDQHREYVEMIHKMKKEELDKLDKQYKEILDYTKNLEDRTSKK